MSKVIKVLGVETHYQTPTGELRLSAVDWWRIVNPLTAVAKKYPDIQVDFIKKIVKDGEIEEASYEEIGKNYDIIYSSYIDTPKAYAWIKAMCEKFNMSYVMDMDDNIFDIDSMNPANIVYYEGSEGLRNATIIIQDADYMVASTEHLANVLSRYRKKPIVLPNYIDPETYKYNGEKIEEHDGIYIGYQGSSTHYSDFMNTGVMFALRRLLAEYDDLKFYTIGMAFDDMKKYFPDGKFVIGEGERDHDKWREKWKTIPIDIGIAPLINTSFNLAKSSIKYYEYSLRGIPGVYSWVGPYINVVKEHETGYLAQDKTEWYEKLKLLIEDEKARKRISQNARKDVLDNYTIDTHVDKIYKFLKDVYSKK